MPGRSDLDHTASVQGLWTFSAPMTGRPAGAPNRASAKVLLGRRRGPRRSRPQNEFAFDAQELGDAPALLVALGSR